MKFTLHEKQTLNAFDCAYIFTADEKINFSSGQFFRLKKIGDSDKNARAFSAASAPGAYSITFLVKNIPEGVISGYLANAPLGTEIEAIGPFGKFILSATDERRVYLATGTGIAPIMSFIESEPAIGADLLFGVHDEEHLIWKEKLPRHAYITVSHPTGEWSGLRGRITEHLDIVTTKIAHTGFYICGNPEMVTDVRKKLLEKNVSPHDIHFEIY